MNFKIPIIAAFTLLLIQSCATSKSNTTNTIFWVSGIKTECSGGAGKMMCLNVHRGESLDNPNWEYFYADIEGFEFKEGVMKKIEVKEEKLAAKDVPADGSSIKYTLVKELQAQPDYRALVQGSWLLNRFNDQPINRSVVLPTLDISLDKMRISGNGGCNSYFASIEKLTFNTMNFSEIGSTLMACQGDFIENEYLVALSKASTYQIKGPNLLIYNAEGKKILSFIKPENTAPKEQLHDIWVAIRIDGNPINRMATMPRLEINLKEKQVMGNDGCNSYFGPFEQLTATAFSLGTLSVTEKLCRSMEVPDRYQQALQKAATYELIKLNLMLKDIDGNEVLAFLKVD